MVGGFDGIRRLRSGEVYDPETQEWTDLPDMCTPRSEHSLAVVQGKIVVIGGYTGEDATSKVEQLHLRTNIWEEMEDRPCKRSDMSSVSISFNKLKEEARDTYRSEMASVVPDDAGIPMDDDDVSIGNSIEEIDTSSDMSFDESEEEMME